MYHDNLYTSQLAALPCPTLYVNCDQVHLLSLKAIKAHRGIISLVYLCNIKSPYFCQMGEKHKLAFTSGKETLCLLSNGILRLRLMVLDCKALHFKIHKLWYSVAKLRKVGNHGESRNNKK